MRSPIQKIVFAVALGAVLVAAPHAAEAAKAKSTATAAGSSKYFSCYAYYDLVTACMATMGQMSEDGLTAAEKAKAGLLAGGQALIQKQSNPPKSQAELDASAGKTILSLRNAMQENFENDCAIDDLNDLIEEKGKTCEKLASQVTGMPVAPYQPVQAAPANGDGMAPAEDTGE